MATTNVQPASQISEGKADIKNSADDTIDIERTATSGTEHNGDSKEILGDNNAGFHRSLTRRKVMMMTFGAGIGTGLWVGTGQALYYGMSSLNYIIFNINLYYLAGPGGLAVTYTLTAWVKPSDSLNCIIF